MKGAVRIFSPKNLSDYIEDLASLRIKVFREFPYLYDGDLSYEKNYLRRYENAADAFIALASMEDEIIGATTGIPMSQEDETLKIPLIEAGMDINKVFYFGESIILTEYRGNKIGHRFFELREEHANKVVPNLEYTCFCAVNRDGHPLTPKNYRPLHRFWNRLGYYKSELKVNFPWKDIDKEQEDEKEMFYWFKKV